MADEGAVVWVQDYQLQLVPQMLRELRPDLHIGFFLHIPFPPTELFSQLPVARPDPARACSARTWSASSSPAAPRTSSGWSASGSTWRPGARPSTHAGRADGHGPRLPHLDRRGLAARAGHRATRPPRGPRRSAHDLGDPKTLFLGVDRLDYTKGLPERIQAFGELVAEGAIDPDEAALVQVATPSRERVEQYRHLRDDIDRLVGRINGDVGRIGRPPITYLHTSYPREEMAALYRAADVMVVTPLRDGMNLVAKEYVACRQADDGALVLSEFAGAAQELRQAYLVNPHDIDGLKETMVEAHERPSPHQGPADAAACAARCSSTTSTTGPGRSWTT